MKVIPKASLALAALTVLGGSANSPAQAQVTEYTDQASFTAAAPSLTTLDFAGALPPQRQIGELQHRRRTHTGRRQLRRHRKQRAV